VPSILRPGVLRGPLLLDLGQQRVHPPPHAQGHQDRGEGGGLHLRLLHQPVARSSSRTHQGPVGM